MTLGSIVAYIWIEYFYKDFFDAPRSSILHTRTSISKRSIVRFHDQVKVKKIKAKGKGLPVSTMLYEEDDDDDDDGDFTLEDMEDIDDEVDDEDEGEDGNGDGDVGDEDGDDDDDEGNRATIERLKDDLFAEEGEEQKGEEYIS